MASWANQENQPHPYDMDSNGHRLKVRDDSGAYQESDYRVDIKETGTGEKALKVDGEIKVEKGGYNCGSLKPVSVDNNQHQLLEINAKHGTTSGDPDVLIGWHYTNESEYIGNRLFIAAKQVGIGGDQGTREDCVVAMKAPVRVVGGETSYGELIVPGRITTGHLDSLSSTQPETLKIADENAPDVEIAQAGVETRVKGSLHVSENALVTGELEVDSDLTLLSGDLTINPGRIICESSGATLNGATIVNESIADAVPLSVRQTADGNTNKTLHVENISTHADAKGIEVTAPKAIVAYGKIISDGEIVTPSFIAGTNKINLAKDTEITANLKVEKKIETELELIRTGTFKATEREVEILTPASIITHEKQSTGLLVKCEENNNAPLVQILSHEGNPNSVGLRTAGATALIAEGNAVITGETEHAADVKMQGNRLFMGGSGAQETIIQYENGRLNFLIGGQIRFYIDETGGHNA